MIKLLVHANPLDKISANNSVRRDKVKFLIFQIKENLFMKQLHIEVGKILTIYINKTEVGRMPTFLLL